MFDYEHKNYLICCHDYYGAKDSPTQGKKIPLAQLTRHFNDEFLERPPRTEASIQSCIQRDSLLSKVRKMYK